jgi:membrane associated rhomboid family serine protease
VAKFRAHRYGRRVKLDFAPVTHAIVALDLAVFAVQVLLGGGAPAVVGIPQREQLLFGATYPLATIGEARWETLVTAGFLHSNILHLAINMLFLVAACPLVERAVGPARVAPLYLAAGVVGNLASTGVAAVRGSEIFGVGASGAIAGVLAAGLVFGLRTQGRAGALTRSMAWGLGVGLALGLLEKVRGGNADNYAHLGGAIAGAAIALMWRREREPSAGATRVTLGGCGAVVVACIAIVGVRDRTDRFAAMMLPERIEYTQNAIEDGRCRDAYDALLACERLRRPRPGARATPLFVSPTGAARAEKLDERDVVRALRMDVESECGRR